MCLHDDRVFAVVLYFEDLSRVKDYNLQVAKVFFLTFEVWLAFFANIVARFTDLFVNIVAGNEDDFEPLIVKAFMMSVYLEWIIVIPVDTVEAALWIAVNNLKRTFMGSWDGCETFKVSILALVIVKQFFVFLSIFFAKGPHNILDERGIISDLFFEETLYCERKSESFFIQVHLDALIDNSLFDDFRYLRIVFIDKMDKF